MRKEDKSTIIEQIAATVKEYGHFTRHWKAWKRIILRFTDA